MKLENQVCSLELAKKLKELGFKQNSIFCWNEIETVKSGKYWRIYYKGTNVNHSELDYSAFTIAELGEILPAAIFHGEDRIDFWLQIHKYSEYEISYRSDCQNLLAETNDSNEVNGRAKMLIYLLENGLIECQ